VTLSIFEEVIVVKIYVRTWYNMLVLLVIIELIVTSSVAVANGFERLLVAF